MTTKAKLAGGALILVSALATGNISNAKNYEVKFSKDTINFKGVAAVGKIKKNDKSVAFLQTGLRSEANKRITASAGIGKRFLVNDNNAIAGVNFFADYQTHSKHRRLGIGLEYQRQNFKINFNKYFKISYQKSIDGYTEAPLSGYDLYLVGQAPFLPWAKIKTAIYRWNSDDGSDIKNSILGVNIQITQSISFEFGKNNNNGLSSHYANLSLKLPYSTTEKYTDFKIASTAFGEPQEMSLSSINFIDRSDDNGLRYLNINT
jgi:hypothetical protein